MIAGPFLSALGTGAAAFVAGFLLARSRYRRAQAVPTSLSLPRELTEERNYEQARSFYVEMYKTSMQQYDKLVPWSAAGALVLSVTLLHDMASRIGSPGLKVLLGISWLCLVLSLAASISGHFTSSRLYSSTRAALDLVHRGDGTQQTLQEAAKHHRIAKVNGWITYVLNYASGAGLVAGLVLLGLFAYLSLSARVQP